MKLTEPQRCALKALAKATYLSPGEIGYALTEGRKPPLRSQGAGRLGGTMGNRLVKMGLAKHYKSQFAGKTWYRGYSINALGRSALRDAD